MTPRLMVGSLQWTILPLMRRGTSEKAQIVEGKSSSGCVELEACELSQQKCQGGRTRQRYGVQERILDGSCQLELSVIIIKELTLRVSNAE